LIESLMTPRDRERLRGYRRDYAPSFSKLEVARYFGERGVDPREEQALEAICPPSPHGTRAAGAPN